jgi:tetratricopeptide (TPR) repeat protein
LRSGHPQRAESILEKAKLLYDKLNIDAGRADVLGHLGIVYMMQDKPRQSEIALVKALNLNSLSHRQSQQADNYGNLANLYWSQGLKKEAKACYVEARRLYAQTGQLSKEQKVSELLIGLCIQPVKD